jgi:hypothetical protein
MAKEDNALQRFGMSRDVADPRLLPPFKKPRPIKASTLRILAKCSSARLGCGQSQD